MTGNSAQTKPKPPSAPRAKGNGKGNRQKQVWKPKGPPRLTHPGGNRLVASGVPTRANHQDAICKLDQYDPRCYLPIPCAVHEGNAFPIWDVATVDMTIHPHNSMILCCTICGHSATLGFGSINDHAVTPALSSEAYTAPVIKDSGVTFARAMKAGLSMVNVTSRMKQQGRVYVLATDQRMELSSFDWDVALHETVATKIRSHPDVEKYSSIDFTREKTYVCHPTNNINYQDYVEWDAMLDVAEFCKMISVNDSSGAHVEHSLIERPMSVIWVYFAPTAEPQDWSFTLRGAWYARYPINTVMGRRMEPVPTQNLSDINTARVHAEKAKGMPRTHAAHDSMQHLKSHGMKAISKGIATAAKGGNKVDVGSAVGQSLLESLFASTTHHLGL
jgi:hypothetical protein